MTDFLGDAPHAEPDELHVEQQPAFWREPMPLAVLTLALALLSLISAPLLSGRTYAAAFGPDGFFSSSDDSSRPSTTYLQVGAWISVGIPLLIAMVAGYGRRRLIADDPRWVRGLLEAALGLALVSAGLHLLLAVIVQAKGGDSIGLLVG